MLKKFNDFKKGNLNEENIYNNERISSEEEIKFQSKLEPYTKKQNKIILEMDKIYNSISSDSIMDIVNNGSDYYNDLYYLNEKLNNDSDTLMRDITNWLDNLSEEEFEEWEELGFIAEEIKSPVYNKYNILYSLIDKVKDIAEMDFEAFEDNSANIVIDDTKKIGE